MNDNKPCTSLKEKDDTLALNGDVTAKFDNALVPVMLGVQFSLVATKSLYDWRVLIHNHRDLSFPISPCVNKHKTKQKSINRAYGALSHTH